MRPYTMPDGNTIDLNSVLSVGPIFFNKNDHDFDCYEVYLNGSESIGVFVKDLSRAEFMSAWGGA